MDDRTQWTTIPPRGWSWQRLEYARWDGRWAVRAVDEIDGGLADEFVVHGGTE